MAAKKGHPRYGGRQKGSENKATKDIKEAYKNLVEMNLDNMTQWLEKIADDNPEKAMYIIITLSEYVIPKLARQELTALDGKDLIPYETPTREQIDKIIDKI